MKTDPLRAEIIRTLTGASFNSPTMGSFVDFHEDHLWLNDKALAVPIDDISNDQLRLLMSEAFYDRFGMSLDEYKKKYLEPKLFPDYVKN